jgi:hypothetical protein
MLGRRPHHEPTRTGQAAKAGASVCTIEGVALSPASSQSKIIEARQRGSLAMQDVLGRSLYAVKRLCTVHSGLGRPMAVGHHGTEWLQGKMAMPCVWSTGSQALAMAARTSAGGGNNKTKSGRWA